MSKRWSFEEIVKRKMHDLPLPDEDESWLKMKQLLDEKTERKAFIFFRNEKVIAGIMLLLLLSFWLMIAPEEIQKKSELATAINSLRKADDLKQNHLQQTTNHRSLTKEIKDNGKDSLANYLSSGQTQNHHKSSTIVAKKSSKTNQKQNTNTETALVKRNKPYQLNLLNKNSGKKHKIEGLNQDEKSNYRDDLRGYAYSNKVVQNKQSDDSFKTSLTNSKSDDSLVVMNKDSANKTILEDSLQKAASLAAAASAAKKLVTIKKHNSFFVDAGIELKQQLPIADQKLISYNYNGNKTLLPDYLPSVYVKLEKEKNWFVQGEFSYASPRLLKDFVYLQKTKADYAHSSIAVTTYHLQKTYYTQVPVSFNLFIHSSWSIGAGAMYSWLRGAVAKQEVATGSSPSSLQTITAEKLPIKGFTDSFLYKTQTSLLLQAAYEKNKWSFGLRYLQDVQPFITYTLPNGEKNDKRNASLELIIRYRLFRSSKFSLKTK